MLIIPCLLPTLIHVEHIICRPIIEVKQRRARLVPMGDHLGTVDIACSYPLPALNLITLLFFLLNFLQYLLYLKLLLLLSWIVCTFSSLITDVQHNCPPFFVCFNGLSSHISVPLTVFSMQTKLLGSVYTQYLKLI